jgi:hypothetical protein
MSMSFLAGLRNFVLGPTFQTADESIQDKIPPKTDTGDIPRFERISIPLVRQIYPQLIPPKEVLAAEAAEAVENHLSEQKQKQLTEAHDACVTAYLDKVVSIAHKNSAGQLHRDDGPAVINSEGKEEFWIEGVKQDQPVYGMKDFDGVSGITYVMGNRRSRHRLGGPATQGTSGYKAWWQYGKRHRDDGPAIVSQDGTVEYWIHGVKQDKPVVKREYGDPAIYGYVLVEDPLVQHRIGGPTFINENKRIEEWRIDGVLHREDGPAKTWADSVREHWVRGVKQDRPIKHVPYKDSIERWVTDDHEEVLHRIGGPAFVTATRAEYFRNGKPHRDDGPAEIVMDEPEQYWIEGVKQDRPVRAFNILGRVEYLDPNGKRHRVGGPAIEYVNGTKEYWINGERHREDGPAVENDQGYKAYWVNGERHRENGCAVEHANGIKEYWVHGKLHREVGPAITRTDGLANEYWIEGVKQDRPVVAIFENEEKKYHDQTGRLHRIGGPAKIEKDGTLSWCQNGLLHREDGPAYVYPKRKYSAWYINGERHREDGPSMVYDDKPRDNQYHIHGQAVSKNDLPNYVEPEKKIVVDPADPPVGAIVTEYGDLTLFSVSGYVLMSRNRKNGEVIWYNAKGQIHRDDDLPAFITKSGLKQWYQNGYLTANQNFPNSPRHNYTTPQKVT